MMSTMQVLTSTWDLQPSVLLGCAALLIGYATLTPLNSKHGYFFSAGVIALLLALVSPLDQLGDTYLFSAHMLQHLILLVIVPPLLLLGVPRQLAARAMHWRVVNRAEHMLGLPLLAWVVGEATLWGWHIPVLYDAALLHQGVHIAQHLTFLITSTILWWPVIGPVPERRRMSPLAASAYLLATGLTSSVLGIILTFASPGIYAIYEHPPGSPAIIALVRHGWGLSAATDQQLGGLLMWVVSTPIYLLAIVGMLVRWYREPEVDTVLPTSTAESGAGEIVIGKEEMPLETSFMKQD